MNKILKTLGLAKVSGNLVYGQKLMENIVKQKVFLVILGFDTAFNNLKKIRNKCHYYNIELIEKFSKKEISKAIGKQNTAVIGIIDKNLSQKIINELKE